MAELRKPTLMTMREAEEATLKARYEGRYSDAITLKDLALLYAEAEVYQNNERSILENPRSLSNKPSYLQVRQLINTLSYEAVPEALRNQITQLESKLPSQGSY